MKVNLNSFEKLNRKKARALEDGEISIAQTCFSMHKNIAKDFVKYVQIYLDKKNNRVILKKGYDLLDGFKIRNNKDSKNYVTQATTFAKISKKGIFKGTKIKEGWLFEGVLLNESEDLQ